MGLQKAYPPPPTGIQLSSGSGAAGSSVLVTGEGCPAGSTVIITLPPTQVGTTVANNQGDFSIRVTVPAGTPAGTHQIVATCAGITLSSQFTVLGAAVTTPLPFTGLDTRTWLAASLAFVVAGSALVLMTGKRRQRRLTEHAS